MRFDYNKDIICAPATPSGTGGVSMIRISGENALQVVAKVWSAPDKLLSLRADNATVGWFQNRKGERLDQCVAVYFKAPRSFTGEDVVELSFHGSPWIIRQAMLELAEVGLRPATQGEFTRRAFLNGKIDLAQAEGIADLIAADSRKALKMALSQVSGGYSSYIEKLRDKMVDFASMLELELDFSEEDVEFADRVELLKLAQHAKSEIEKLIESYKSGQVFKDGIKVVIAGIPNAGKSTLLNALAEEQKAIVTEIPGTTRDSIEITREISDWLFRFVDTAGLRETNDPVEKIGVSRAQEMLRTADIILWMIDGAVGQENIYRQFQVMQNELKQVRNNDCQVIALINKTDICREFSSNQDVYGLLKAGGFQKEVEILQISVKNDIEALKRVLLEKAEIMDTTKGEIAVTNARHYAQLRNAAESLSRAIEGIQNQISADFIAQDVREALAHLGEITGAISSTDLLHTIFSRFCIGK